jgi:O-antigen/teichoic acid export membrane protein
MVSIKQLAIRGTLWMIVGYSISRGLSFCSSLIMTRLLMPELFGLMSIVYTLITALHLFSDFGISPAVIRSKHSDNPDFLNTAWTLSIIRSTGLWFFGLLLAYPSSQFYGEPRLVWLLPIVTLNSFVQGFNSTGMFLLNREMMVKQLTIFELSSQVISILVMITWAKINPSIWALVAGTFASSLFQLVQSHRINPGPSNRFAWNRAALDEIASLGRWIFFSTILTFLANQADRLILGKLSSLKFLGVYGIAWLLAEAPKQVIDAILDKVVFPTFIKFADLPRSEFKHKIEKIRLPILLGAAFGLAIIISFGDVAVSVLYDRRYADAALILPILALGFWPPILNASIDKALIAIGNPRFIAYGVFWSAVFLIAGMILGYRWFGELGAVTAVSFSNIPPYIIITYGLWQEKLACFKQDFITTALLVGLIVLMIAVAF